MESSANAPLPEMIGPYRVVARLSRGGMATVFRCVDPASSNPVAVKVAERNYDEELNAECKALCALKHQNIIEIRPIPRGAERSNVFIDKAMVDGEPTTFIALEYLDGGSLQDAIDDSRKSDFRLTLPEIEAIVAAVGGALDYAHRRKIFHRDVKPANILLSQDRRHVVLTDFGIVQDAGTAGSGARLGTAPYLAPELARGESADARSDLYALGVILYQLCVGRLPFEGSPATILRRLMSGEPAPAPRQLNPAMPPALEKVILRSIHPHPARRYPSAAALIADLHWATGVVRNRLTSAALAVGALLLVAAVAGLFLPVIAGAGAAPNALDRALPANPTASPTWTTVPSREMSPTSIAPGPAPVTPPPTLVVLSSADTPPATATSVGPAIAEPTATLVALLDVSDISATPTVVSDKNAPEIPRLPTVPPSVTATLTKVPARVLSLSAAQYPPGSVLLTWSLSGGLAPDETYDVQAWQPSQPVDTSIANSNVASWRIGGGFLAGDYSWTIAVVRKKDKATVIRASQVMSFHWSGQH